MTNNVAFIVAGTLITILTIRRWIWRRKYYHFHGTTSQWWIRQEGYAIGIVLGITLVLIGVGYPTLAAWLSLAAGAYFTIAAFWPSLFSAAVEEGPGWVLSRIAMAVSFCAAIYV